MRQLELSKFVEQGLFISSQSEKEKKNIYIYIHEFSLTSKKAFRAKFGQMMYNNNNDNINNNNNNII